MQGQVPQGRRLNTTAARPNALAFALLLLLGISFFAATAAIAQNDLTRAVNVTVPESATATVRLLKLTKGTRLAFVIEGEQPLSVLILDEDNFNRFPQPGASALIGGRAGPALSFGVQLPADGNFYLVLDNREHAAPNRVRMQLRATLPAGARKPSEPKPQVQQY